MGWVGVLIWRSGWEEGEEEGEEEEGQGDCNDTMKQVTDGTVGVEAWCSYKHTLIYHFMSSWHLKSHA